MLKDILGVVEKTNTRFVLITFLAISTAVAVTESTILRQPTSWLALVLPVCVFLSYAAVWIWISLVHWLNSQLAENDVANWGALIGCSILAFAMLEAASFLAARPEELTFAVLGTPGFFYLTTLVLVAVETIKIER